ncbi:MAG: hypothetical protein RQ867_07255 [Mariprofundaceae bacterium]|nr:hypothetical protein [Mariprofundaceae bacterium]
MRRKIVLAIIGFAVVGIGTSIYVMMNLDEFVKEAIQTLGSEAIGTQVSVTEVKLALESGETSIIGLNVSNPDGFSGQHIFELGMISSNMNPDTLNQNPLIIDEVTISAPFILYEINQSGMTNVDALTNSLAQSNSRTDNNSGDNEDGLRMIIGKLIIEEGRVSIRTTAPGDTGQVATLPAIEIFDIGKTGGGVTPVELARILASTLLDHVKSTVTRPDTEQRL